MARALVNCQCILLGDVQTGKSSLIKSFKHGLSDHDFHVYNPTILCENDNYAVEVANRREIQLGIYDTSGQKGSKVRAYIELLYPNVQVFVVCFSVDNPATFASVRDYVDNIRHHESKDAKIILVGTKTDLRDCSQRRRSRKTSNPSQQIQSSQARALCAELQLLDYLETSAGERDKVTRMFRRVAEEATGLRKAESKEKQTFLKRCAHLVKSCCAKAKPGQH